MEEIIKEISKLSTTKAIQNSIYVQNLSKKTVTFSRNFYTKVLKYLRLKKFPEQCQCSHHIETSQLICRANQLTGFYMMETLAVEMGRYETDI